MTFVKQNILAALLAASAGAASAAPAFLVTYENAGVTNTTATFSSQGVETFDSRSTGGNESFATNFGGSTGSGATAISGVYSGVDVMANNQFGGAGGTGNYGVTFSTTGYTLRLTSGTPVTYFGYWLSALDAFNQVNFFRNGAQVFSFTASDVLALTGNCPTSAYCGNPSAAYRGQNSSQPYVFLNFFDQDTLGFDTVQFIELANDSSAGYESDNHTVGRFLTTSGTAINNVPEPGSLALLGLGLVGLAAARKRKPA